MTQPAEDVGLGEADAGFDRRLVLWLSRSRRQHADVVVRRHRGVAAVHLGVVERRLVDAALEIVRHQQARCRPVEPEHPDVRANPVRKALRPGCLGVGQVRGAEHGDEDLRHAHLAGERIGDRDLLAGIVDERLVTGDVGLAHRRRQAPLERPVQLDRTGCSRSPPDEPRRYSSHKIDRLTPGRFISRTSAAQSGSGWRRAPRLAAGRGEQALFQRLVRQIGRQRPAEPRGARLVSDNPARWCGRRRPRARWPERWREPRSVIAGPAVSAAWTVSPSASAFPPSIAMGKHGPG